MNYKYEYILYFDEGDNDRSIKNIIKKVEEAAQVIDSRFPEYVKGKIGVTYVIYLIYEHPNGDVIFIEHDAGVSWDEVHIYSNTRIEGTNWEEYIDDHPPN